MARIVNHIGEKYTTFEGYEIEVISLVNSSKYSVRFTCGLIKNNFTYALIKRGRVSYPYHPKIYKVGFSGIGVYKSTKGGKINKNYNTWISMLRRAYCEKHHEKYPTYKDVTVCDEWHNFQNFAKWFEENWKDHMDSSWHLDKDILSEQNKMYSPQTCAFVPHEINTILLKSTIRVGNLPIGVFKVGKKFQAKINKNGNYILIGYFNTSELAFQAYKIAKEEYIKEVADKWKGLIDPRVYKIMYEHKIKLRD